MGRWYYVDKTVDFDESADEDETEAARAEELRKSTDTPFLRRSKRIAQKRKRERAQKND